MAKLVFETLRVGFPTADVVVYLNGDIPKQTQAFIESKVDATFVETNTIHHEWIDMLYKSQEEPFWICDTDVIFYGPVEHFESDLCMLGCLIPEWNDEFSGCITRSRLHPSLMRIDPNKLHDEVSKFISPINFTEFTPIVNLFYPRVLSHNGQRIFHDTLSSLYHAVGGQAFTDEQRDAYFHFHFGSISDIVLPRLKSSPQMAEAREQVLNNPELGKGLWRAQDEYYRARQPQAGQSVIAPIDANDGETARRWNYDLCRGNVEAMAFNDLWYNYCHGIDDLIDTMRDGRPTMSPEEMIGLFLNAVELYNCPFWKKYGDKLHPIVVQITNDYADSVEWERSSKLHLRRMSDVLRMAGNDMYCQVAYICGGREHMRRYSKLIKERDWLGQHDLNGNPT